MEIGEAQCVNSRFYSASSTQHPARAPQRGGGGALEPRCAIAEFLMLPLLCVLLCELLLLLVMPLSHPNAHHRRPTTSQLDLIWPANFRPIPQKDSACGVHIPRRKRKTAKGKSVPCAIVPYRRCKNLLNVSNADTMGLNK
jgi:hypothetical protein